MRPCSGILPGYAGAATRSVCFARSSLSRYSIRQHTSAYVSIRQHTSAYAAYVRYAAASLAPHSLFTQFTCFTGTKAQILPCVYAYVIRRHAQKKKRPNARRGTLFTFFTSLLVYKISDTDVYICIEDARCQQAWQRVYSMHISRNIQALQRVYSMHIYRIYTLPNYRH
jgi:hypothetical protein